MGIEFIGRDKELEILNNVYLRSKKHSQMSILLGRRRVGKTRLVLEFCKNKKFLYFFISRKNEVLLCEEFVQNIKHTLDIPVIGEIKSFAEVFKIILEYSKEQQITLVIDEFQEFFNVNKSVFSEIQNLWDIYKDITKLNLVILGSVYSLMKRIFENKKEPLFNRANRKLNIKPFTPDIIKNILNKKKSYSNEKLLDFYTITGGMAKYIEFFYDENVFDFNSMLDLIIDENSFFIDEGKNLLIEEFGKEYMTYFSILALISSSKTSRSQIESIIQKNIGGYLERLEKDYSIIQKLRPVFSKEGSKNQKYIIVDNFVSFWFRFIYKYRSLIEIENFTYLKEIINRDFNTYKGRFLEKVFISYLKQSQKYSIIGNYWEKNGENEIDIIAVNEKNKEIEFFDVKLNKNKISIGKLKTKSLKILAMYKDYKAIYRGLSIEDIDEFLFNIT